MSPGIGAVLRETPVATHRVSSRDRPAGWQSCVVRMCDAVTQARRALGTEQFRPWRLAILTSPSKSSVVRQLISVAHRKPVVELGVSRVEPALMKKVKEILK